MGAETKEDKKTNSSTSALAGDSRSWHDIIVEKSTRSISVLKEAIDAAEKALDEPKKLNVLLRQEQDLIKRLKALHVSQSQLQDENQSLFARNSHEALSLQYLEIARVKRPGELVDLGTSDICAVSNGKSESPPPPIMEVLERRRASPRPDISIEKINETLENAERRREELLQARVKAKKIRETQIIKNLDRIRREREEAALELKRKEYVTQQRNQMQQTILRQEHEKRVLKRRESAEKRKAEYDQVAKKLKERVGAPKCFSEVHAKQKQKINEMTKARTEKVASMKTEFAPSETIDKLSRRHSKSGAPPPLVTPIKSLVEAQKRREHPMAFYTPRTIAEAMVPRSANEEKEMHDSIIKELERLKEDATNPQDIRDLESDIATEQEEHAKAMKSLKDRQDIEPAKKELEFKFDDCTDLPGKKRKNKQSGIMSPFQAPHGNGKKSRQKAVAKTPEHAVPTKKMKATPSDEKPST